MLQKDQANEKNIIKLEENGSKASSVNGIRKSPFFKKYDVLQKVVNSKNNPSQIIAMNTFLAIKLFLVFTFSLIVLFTYIIRFLCTWKPIFKSFFNKQTFFRLLIFSLLLMFNSQLKGQPYIDMIIKPLHMEVICLIRLMINSPAISQYNYLMIIIR